MDTVIPGSVAGWQFGGKSGNLRSQNAYSTANGGNGYNMFCRANSQYLTYQKTNVGINLGYISSPNEHKIHFRLPDGQQREILTGERVALGIGGGDAFLRYAHRNFGINLDWSGSPVFEWLIFGATLEKGKPIPTSSWCAVINERVEKSGGERGDFLVYLNRPVGGDVGWTTSPDWKDTVFDVATGDWRSLIKRAL